MSAIKLFGKTISPDHLFSDASLSQQRHSSFASSTSLDSKDESSDYESSNGSEEKAKKPEKIIPCPRCSSMDTKFCYFNNYNVNQPRHFCKQCQRYWTSGGTMRNVAVGSGRRKTKTALDHTDFLFSFYCASPPSLLGKHSRDEWRINNVSDAVGMFRESKAPARIPLDDRALLLRANPAAFSRSLNFHERA